MKTLIVALGGNALIKFGEEGTTEEQFHNLRVPISQIAELARDSLTEIIITNKSYLGFGFDLVLHIFKSHV